MCPIYSYKCSKCDKEKDEFKEFEDYKEPVVCECGTIMGKLFPSVTINMRGRRGITSRTDIEIESMSREQSMNELAKSNAEAEKMKQLGEIQ